MVLQKAFNLIEFLYKNLFAINYSKKEFTK